MIDPALIDAVATEMCQQLGLPPYETVMVGIDQVWTTTDRRNAGGYVPGMAINVPRWQCYRGQAEQAIAAFRACTVLGIMPR